MVCSRMGALSIVAPTSLRYKNYLQPPEADGTSASLSRAKISIKAHHHFWGMLLAPSRHSTHGIVIPRTFPRNTRVCARAPGCDRPAAVGHLPQLIVRAAVRSRPTGPDRPAAVGHLPQLIVRAAVRSRPAGPDRPAAVGHLPQLIVRAAVRSRPAGPDRPAAVGHLPQLLVRAAVGSRPAGPDRPAAVGHLNGFRSSIQVDQYARGADCNGEYEQNQDSYQRISFHGSFS